MADRMRMNPSHSRLPLIPPRVPPNQYPTRNPARPTQPPRSGLPSTCATTYARAIVAAHAKIAQPIERRTESADQSHRNPEAATPGCHCSGRSSSAASRALVHDTRRSRPRLVGMTEVAPVTDALVGAIRNQLPELRLLTDEVDRESYRRDETAYLQTGLPCAVALPTETRQVAELVRLCGEFGVPIVPRGAGTGLSGGAAGIEGALTIAFTAMDKVLEIDGDNLVVVTQPGIINAALKKAVAAEGPVLRARSGELRDLLDRRQPRDERGRPVLHQVRPDARVGARARGRDGRWHGAADRRQERQGRGGLLADPPHRRVAGDPGDRDGGDPAAAPDCRRHARRCIAFFASQEAAGDAVARHRPSRAVAGHPRADGPLHDRGRRRHAGSRAGPRRRRDAHGRVRPAGRRRPGSRWTPRGRCARRPVRPR